jgi:hypothetical protein
MNLRRWLSIILGMGLIVSLSPPGAMAWPNQPNPRQQNHRSFTPHRPQGNAFGWQGHRPQWRGPQRNAYGWHGQRAQWHQPRGNARGWYGHRPQGQQWQHQQRNANGWQGQQPQHQQWQHQQRSAYQWQGQRPQGQQSRQPLAQGPRPGDRQWQQPPAGQPHNSTVPYTPAVYQGQPRGSSTPSGSHGYSSNTSGQVSSANPASGNSPGRWSHSQTQAQEPPRVTQAD